MRLRTRALGSEGSQHVGALGDRVGHAAGAGRNNSITVPIGCLQQVNAALAVPLLSTFGSQVLHSIIARTRSLIALLSWSSNSQCTPTLQRALCIIVSVLPRPSSTLGGMEPLADIDEQLRHTSRRLHALNHQARRQQRRLLVDTLEADNRRLLRTAAYLSHRGAGAAGLLWRTLQKRVGVVDVPIAELEHEVFDDLGRRPPGSRAAHVAPVSARHRHIAVAAARFVAETELYVWIHTCNERQGVAPQTSAILRHYRELPLWAALEPPLRHGEILTLRPRNAQLLWLVRFRRRWRCTVNRFKVENIMDQGELHDKVCAASEQVSAGRVHRRPVLCRGSTWHSGEQLARHDWND